MNHWIPASWNQGGLIHKFNCENSVVMANMIPVSPFQSNGKRFGLLFVDSDVAVFACSRENGSATIKIDCVDGIFLLTHLK